MNIGWWKRLYRLLRLEFPYWTLFKNYVFTAGAIVSGRDYPVCLMTDLSALLFDKTEIMWNHDREFVDFLKQIYSQDNEDVTTSINRLYECLTLARKIKNDDGKAYCLGRCRYESDSYIIEGAVARILEQDEGDIHWENWLGEIEKTQHELSRSLLLMALYDCLPEDVEHDDRVGLIKMIPHERRRSFTALKELHRPRALLPICPEIFSSFSAFIAHPADKKVAKQLEWEKFRNVKS